MRWQPPLKLNILRRHCKENGFQKKKKLKIKKIENKNKLGFSCCKTRTEKQNNRICMETTYCSRFLQLFIWKTTIS